MIVSGFKCDCTGCNVIAQKMNHITLKIKDDVRSFDVCDQCMSKIEPMFINKESEKTAGIEFDTANTGKLTPREMIDKYGLDKLRDDYVNKNMSAAELAQRVGINRTALISYLHRTGITKNKKNTDETGSNSKDESESG